MTHPVGRRAGRIGVGLLLLASVAGSAQASESTPAESAQADWRLGPEVAGYVFGSDSMGAGGGARLDLPRGRWVFGATLGGRVGYGSQRPEGRVRMVWFEAEASARYTVFAVGGADVRFGAAVAPLLVLPEGLPATDAFQTESGVNAGIAARAIGEVDVPIVGGQSLLTRLTFGVPPLGFIATLENGRPIGGLAEWELTVSIAWLWSS